MIRDSEAFGRALVKLSQMRTNREILSASRREELLSSSPEYRELDAAQRLCGLTLAGAALEGKTEELPEIRNQARGIQNKKAALLKSRGFESDYLDPPYFCPVCRDSGYVKTGVCDCLERLYREECVSSVRVNIPDKTAGFERFNPGYYSDVIDQKNGISPRMLAVATYRRLSEFCKNIGQGKNLIITGATGLGKTFLSTSAALECASRGVFTVYDTAYSLFAAFEDERFSRGNTEDSRRRTARALTSDLLILDDLGTEMTTAFTVSALYNLINSRLGRDKSTIINTNLNPDVIRERYSEQIFSRVVGDYDVLNLIGEDIRRIKQ